MLPIPLALSVLAVSTTTFFMLGAFYQHCDVLHNLRDLIANDAYAFYIRNKLYNVMQVFKYNPNAAADASPKSRMEEIMKYGFPGLDDIRLYHDFILSYDRRNRVAHWVYEHLREPCVSDKSNVRRAGAQFQPDMNVPAQFRAELSDFRNSGFTRGHLAASGNHRCHQMHCNETFYLTNIAPQVGKGFNCDAWNKLEIYVRNLTERYGSVYVCTGPLYMPRKHPQTGKWFVEYETIGANMVAVPTHFFKVITVESKLPKGKPYMEAYVMPNAPIDNDVDIRTFLCDIQEIERWAGLQFFDGLRRSYFFGSNYLSAPELYNSNFK